VLAVAAGLPSEVMPGADQPGARRRAPQQAAQGRSRPDRSSHAAGSDGSAAPVTIARVYELSGRGRGNRVLVDRLWPRGVRKDEAPFGHWCKDVAPSTELRRWYGHDPARFEEFARRYRDELAGGPAREALDGLRTKALAGPLVLVTATRELELSAARVLQDVLRGRPRA
jgi:uncharacterized protein YeaO (DUF488 family)